MSKPKQEKISFWDLFNSVMVYDDEVAIKEAFGGEVGDLVKKTFAEESSFDIGALRAMALVHFRHSGDADPVATVRGMTRNDFSELFMDADEDAGTDAIPDEPDTELGKGDSKSD